MDESTSSNLPSIVKQYDVNRRKLLDVYEICQTLMNSLRQTMEGKPESNLLQQVDLKSIHPVLRQLGIYWNDKANDESMKKQISEARSKVEACLRGKRSNDHVVDEVLVNSILASCGFSNNNTQIRNPCIAVVGQTKAGKSTFINTLLKSTVVAQKETKCTARVTHLFYCEKTIVAQATKDELIEIKRMRHKCIPPEYLSLDDDKRSDASKINIQIKAGVNCDFLNNGIDIIDSPGLNENTELNTLSKEIVNSTLPIVIYVIDGRLTLTEHDVKDITTMKEKAPGLTFIYLVTKLDIDKRDLRDNPDLVERQVANDKLDKVFTQLINKGFLPKDAKIDACDEFHGASLWSVLKYRQKQINDDTTFHMGLFNRLEKCLSNIMQSHLEASICKAVNILLNFLESVLEKIIQRASKLVHDSKKKLTDVENIEREERIMYNNAISLLEKSKTELSAKLVEILNDKEEFILKPLESLIYPDITDHEIPNGMTQDSNVIRKCQEYIKTTVCIALDTEIKVFVEKEIISQQLKLEDALLDDVSRLSDGGIGKTSFRCMLEKRLAHIYDLQPGRKTSGFNKNSQKYQGINVISNALKKLAHFFANIFQSPPQQPQRICVTNAEWKRQQGQLCISEINRTQFADDVCSTLLKEFHEKHDIFCDSMKNEKEDIMKTIEISEEIRLALVKLAPQFATHYMICLDVQGYYYLGNIEIGKRIGEGAQGKVYECIVGGETMAMKKTLLPSNQLEDAAMEVYYSSFFQHPRLLRLHGVRIEETEDEDVFKVCTLCPLMKCDGTAFLKNEKPSMIQRINVALQVAEAVEYLHNQGIMHRDLKMPNILINHSYEAVVADYGFCKSVGLVNKSFVGTPIHIAPEIVCKATYDSSVDVYSFGILLWYLAEGTGRHPSYARYLTHVGAVLYASAVDGQRPENLPTIPESLWKLMTDCWQENPASRPNITIVIERLKEIIEDFMANN